VKPWMLVGTRELTTVSPTSIRVFQLAARTAARLGITVKTGAAKGADQLAAEEVLAGGGRVILVLPWGSYEYLWVEKMYYSYPGNVQDITFDERVHATWLQSVESLHPAPATLGRAERKLHARNYGAVEGSEVVVALPTPPERGGTSQAMRIGRYLGIPVFNLSLPQEQDKFSSWLRELRET